MDIGISKNIVKKFFERFTGKNETAKIARRYLVMNTFDGILTVLGVVVGTYMAEGYTHPSVILSAGFGASLAMGISGLTGTYLIERSERSEKNQYGTDEQNVDPHEESLFLALVDGLAPVFATLVAVIPFLLSLRNVISIEIAFSVSTIIILLELFSIGAFLGKIAGKNIIWHGLITLVVGAITFILISMLPF